MPDEDRIHIIENPISDEVEEDAEEDVQDEIQEDAGPQTYWRSIYIAAALSFTGSAQFSLYFSSLWPYLQMIDRPLLYAGLTMMLIGNALYLLLEVCTFPKRYLLLVGRLITGIGSANVILLRTYASTASAEKDRTRAIAFVTCGQAIGLTSGPALQLLFTSFLYPGPTLFGNFHLNLYTAPAYLACAMNIFGAAMLFQFFQEHYAGLVEAKSGRDDDRVNLIHAEEQEENASQSSATIINLSTRSEVNLPPYDVMAVFVCLLTRFTYMFINTNLETIGSPYSMMMFAWTEPRTVFYTSVAQGIIGLFTLGIYIIYITLRLERYLRPRESVIYALFILLLFHLITYSWPFIPGHVKIRREAQGQHVGCDPSKFTWCETLTPVNVWLYYATYVLAMGLAFPIINIANTTMFSDILGPRRQGTEQGVLQMAGGSARLLGPILISALYTAYGPTMAWKMEIFAIGATLALRLGYHKRMIPLLQRLNG
ncbi:major facilitator superfamily domain-containing protein [Ditylenchus destructor]|uniref:Major facilitator superfamily domain-containing protein n=1 Tax=Ditylenchus destructor TaxID=166010 RepID=A0AAD4MVT4_9BILA|nr:major facilitator superfamily domain-containing protein [Ditylenchus destructor]